MHKKVSVTADSGANLKLLRRLERQGLIMITAVNLENGKHNKVSDKLGPVGVWGKSKWGDGSVYASEDNIYAQVLRVVGINNYQDARHLEAHYRSGNDIFITEDVDDILSKKDTLFKRFGIRVMSPEDLKALVAPEPTPVEQSD
ncbi:MAG TPA: hypothetical protein VFV38_21235 [Ktedonobacteraceae bacterium]|nr:hypothetical protein [Ktedonobacteraceae bacterium]